MAFRLLTVQTLVITPSFRASLIHAALFRWNPEKVDAEHSEKLLKQNAPALLLSYLRPTISLITSASPYAAYDIPFMNFTE